MERLRHLSLRCVICLEFCKSVWKCVFATVVDLADISLQMHYDSAQWDLNKFKIVIDGYLKMFDRSLSKSKDLEDLLRFLPGVVVQRYISVQGMADLYKIKPNLLERLIKFTVEPLKLFPSSRYILDDYLSGFLLNRDRSQLYYCDPILQHIYICRHFLSLLDESNSFDFRS